jgi:hypothetical protein
MILVRGRDDKNHIEELPNLNGFNRCIVKIEF